MDILVTVQKSDTIARYLKKRKGLSFVASIFLKLFEIFDLYAQFNLLCAMYTLVVFVQKTTVRMSCVFLTRPSQKHVCVMYTPLNPTFI